MIAYGVLGLLRQEPDYGYRLRRRFEAQMGGLWKLNVGQIYQTLRHLERRGMVARADTAPSPRGRRCCRFRITPKGLRALERWTRRPPSQPPRIRDETLVWLSVIGADQREAATRHLERLEAGHWQLLARLAAPSPGRGGDAVRRPVARLGMQAAVLHAEAHLKWLGECRRQLAEAAADVTPAAPV